MAEDAFPRVETQQPPHIYRPIPRRNFTTSTGASDAPSEPHPFAQPQDEPPAPSHDQNSVTRSSSSSDFLAQLNARLLRTYNARNGNVYDSGSGEATQPPTRNKSLLNMTSSTLFGIYDDVGSATAGEQSVAETPWGTGAETPARSSWDANVGSRSLAWENGSGMGSPDAGLGMKMQARRGMVNGVEHKTVKARQAARFKAPRQGIWKYAVISGKLSALFLFGVVYGVIVSHLHDTRELAAVKVDGLDRDNWVYLSGWGLAGVALGSLLPYVDLLWAAQNANQEVEEEKELESSLAEQWSEVVRSVGAFVGIAFAIRRLPWQSTLQLTLTLALVNPALWYILDRSKPGLSFSLIVTSILTSFIFLSNPDVLPSPSLPATMNATTHPSTPSNAPPPPSPPHTQAIELFAGVVSYESLAVVTWVGSVLFCSCVCFGSIGRRLAVFDEWGWKR